MNCGVCGGEVLDGGERGRLSRGEAHTRHTGITAGVGGEKRESSARDAAAAAAQRASERERERESERGREREGERGRAGKWVESHPHTRTPTHTQPNTHSLTHPLTHSLTRRRRRRRPWTQRGEAERNRERCPGAGALVVCVGDTVLDTLSDRGKDILAPSPAHRAAGGLRPNHIRGRALNVYAPRAPRPARCCRG